MSISKRLENARQAYLQGDIEASRRAHTPAAIRQASEEHGGKGSQYMADMVYGGLDGTITTFAVVSGVAGAALGAPVVLIMGLANLFADGFSMATGAYLSSKSEREYYERERQREAWEVEHFPDGERAELYELYVGQGYSREDAQALVGIQTRDPNLWVETMMLQELGLMRDERSPFSSAIATFIAFALAGAIPLIPYLLGLVLPVAPQTAFPISMALSGLALFGVGAAKVFVTQRSWWRSGLEMLLVGGLASAVAYGVGYLLKGLGL